MDKIAIPSAFFLLGQIFFYGSFVKFLGVTLYNPKRSRGAISETGSQPVTKPISDYPGLSVFNYQSTLCAGWNTISTTITEFFVDFNYFSLYVHDFT
jgi:hypothetical protein